MLDKSTLIKIVKLIKESLIREKNIRRYISNRKYHIEIKQIYPDIPSRYIKLKNIDNKIYSYIEVIKQLDSFTILFFNTKNNLFNDDNINFIAKNLEKHFI